jgi:ABC-2 type transport system permease protein
MSPADTLTGSVRPIHSLGLFRSELVTLLRRWRTLALLAVLAAVPVLIGIAVRIETGDGGAAGGGPAFVALITNNGLFLVFASLAATLPFFLPMAVGVVAGDAVAGEAGAGTLRYLLVAPAGRTRLLVSKDASVLAFC